MKSRHQKTLFHHRVEKYDHQHFRLHIAVDRMVRLMAVISASVNNEEVIMKSHLAVARFPTTV